MFRRFFDEGLAQTSYLLACDRTRQAAIIDPRRDIDEYLDVAAQLELTVGYAIETHIHADFVSGARELAAAGAIVIAGPGAALSYPHQEVADKATLHIGDVELTFLHTPGHTPEHISVLAREPGAPVRLFTGDTLFVGAVGRPDLLGDAVMLQLAGDLYESLFSKLLTLPDDVQVYAGHGSGSLCGAGIGQEPHSTIGQERRFNRLLQHTSKQAFVAAVLSDLPETPPYFARMKRVNREGPPLLDLARGVEPPAPIAAHDAAEAVASGAWLLDLRSAAAYGAGHAAGALSMTFGPKLGYWAGWIIPAAARVLLMGDDGAGQGAAARRQLLRVGVDDVDGLVMGGFEAWRAAALPVGHIAQVPAATLRPTSLHQGYGGPPKHSGRRRKAEATSVNSQTKVNSETTLIDVRSHQEWKSGHIPGALHIPLGELLDRINEVPRHGSVATMCEGGYRSSLAASLLARQGIGNVVNVVGGMRAWRGQVADQGAT
jgi:hydroxyacylglutathione hydrolase